MIPSNGHSEPDGKALGRAAKVDDAWSRDELISSVHRTEEAVGRVRALADRFADRDGLEGPCPTENCERCQIAADLSAVLSALEEAEGRNTFLETTRGCDMNVFVQMGLARDEVLARIQELEGALRPFAEGTREDWGGLVDDETFVAARSALPPVSLEGVEKEEVLASRADVAAT